MAALQKPFCNANHRTWCLKIRIEKEISVNAQKEISPRVFTKIW